MLFRERLEQENRDRVKGRANSVAINFELSTYI
jgi:hypothetical protein